MIVVGGKSFNKSNRPNRRAALYSVAMMIKEYETRVFHWWVDLRGPEESGFYANYWVRLWENGSG